MTAERNRDNFEKASGTREHWKVCEGNKGSRTSLATLIIKYRGCRLGIFDKKYTTDSARVLLLNIILLISAQTEQRNLFKETIN